MPWRTQKILTDADGNFIPQVWDPSQNKFIPYEAKVRLSGTLTELEQARELLDAISGKDFATQTTLEAALTELVNVKSELETIKANQLSGDQKVQLKGHLPQPDAPLPVDIHGVAFDEPELVEQLTERDAVEGVLTFTHTIHLIEIFNTDDTNTGTFVVNGIEILMPPGAVFYARIGGTPSNTVTVSGTTSYIIGRYV